MSAVVEPHPSGSGSTVARGRAGGQDKYSFFLVFLIGSAGIVAFRAQFGIWQGYVTAWAAIWMFIYLGLVTMTGRFRLRPDQAGDNLYYLGFLYTLVSLSVALYFFTDAAIALEQIISNFGIALATTIIGVALRVVLHQMREDPVDVEREARLDLAEATNRLRAELDVSVREMNSFCRQMRQSVEEALHGVGDRTGKLLEDSGGQIALAAQNASEGIQEALSALSDRAKSLNGASRRHIQAMEKLIERIDDIEVPKDWVDRRFAPALDVIVKLVDAKLIDIQTKAAASQDAVLREQAVTIDGLRARVEHQVNEFESQLRTLRETGAAEILSAMRALADRQAEAYGLIVRQTEESLAALQQTRQAMDGEVEQARTATRDVMQQLTSMVKTLGEELAGTPSQTTRHE